MTRHDTYETGRVLVVLCTALVVSTLPGEYAERARI